LSGKVVALKVDVVFDAESEEGKKKLIANKLNQMA
jgi:hypothetical protein